MAERVWTSGFGSIIAAFETEKLGAIAVILEGYPSLFLIVAIFAVFVFFTISAPTDLVKELVFYRRNSWNLTLDSGRKIFSQKAFMKKFSWRSKNIAPLCKDRAACTANRDSCSHY